LNPCRVSGTGIDLQIDYVATVEALPSIDPAACRRWALAEFDYRVMARRYVAEYERELGQAPKTNFLKTTG